MARKGRASQALATAAIGSFVAGTLATIGLVLLAPADRRASPSRSARPTTSR